MVKINEHIAEIKKTEEQLRTATGKRRRDLQKYLFRLNKQLRMCEKYLRDNK